jgi:hypothetical protein
VHFKGKYYRLKKEEQERIIDIVVEINRLIEDNKTLRQYKFLFLLLTSKPIIALAKPKRNGVQCTIKVNGKAYGYICCSL